MQSSTASSSSTKDVTLRRLGRAYEDARRRIVGLLTDLDERAASTAVPACPDWSVHDVAAHLAGVCTDIIGGNIAGAASDEWTGAQVDKRTGWELNEIISEWDEAGPQIAAMVDDFPSWTGRQIVADIAVHEHDIRGAIEVPGERDSEAVSIGLDFLVDVVLDAALTPHGLGPLEVRAGGENWIVAGPPPPAAILSAQPFELFRAITGRRSDAQIRRFKWSVDPDVFLPGFDFQPFSIRSTDLIE
jgi:uncharacterized protein (TIGR03083 family)